MPVRTFTHKQTEASATWTINHGLGVNPVVGVRVMEGGALTEILPANIAHTDDKTVVISFTSPRTGEARLA